MKAISTGERRISETQIGSFLQVGVNIKKYIWNHYPVSQSIAIFYGMFVDRRGH